jgi:hypothetical protein
MKTTHLFTGAFALATVLVLQPAFAQTAVTTTSGSGGASVSTTTTSAGTISEFSPDTIVIRSETSPEPVRYSYSKSTTYVDETGAPVSLELVKSGLPVTVHYVKEGDRMVANRVIVRRQTTTTNEGVRGVETRTVERPAAPALIEEKRTQTTTTTRDK